MPSNSYTTASLNAGYSPTTFSSTEMTKDIVGYGSEKANTALSEETTNSAETPSMVNLSERIKFASSLFDSSRIVSLIVV